MELQVLRVIRAPIERKVRSHDWNEFHDIVLKKAYVISFPPIVLPYWTTDLFSKVEFWRWNTYRIAGILYLLAEKVFFFFSVAFVFTRCQKFILIDLGGYTA